MREGEQKEGQMEGRKYSRKRNENLGRWSEGPKFYRVVRLADKGSDVGV